MHGPSSALTHPWDEYPTIPYVDSVVGTLSGAQRRQWKRARNRAFRLWSQAGMEFERVKVLNAPEYNPADPNYPRWDPVTQRMLGDEDAFMRGLLVPGAIHLLPADEGWLGSNVAATGWMFETGGFAIWNMQRLFSDDVRYLVTHEIGHAIGLGHQYQRLGGSPSSVMYVSDKGFRGWSKVPDAHDLLSLRDYYA